MKRKLSTQTYPRTYKKRKIYKKKRSKAQKLKMTLPTNNIQYFDTVQSFTNVSALTGYLLNISAPVRGTGESQFVGSQVIPLAIEVRGAAVGADSYNLMRISMIQFINFAAAPTLTDIYQYAASPPSPFTMRTKENMIVLRDEYFTIDTADHLSQPWKWYVKKKNILPIQFDETGAQTGGAIYISAMSDSAVTTHPTMSYAARIYYVTK